MESGRSLLFSLSLLAFAALAGAHIAHYDDYWTSKADAAKARAKAAYNPDPDGVAAELNTAVRESLELENSTRRSLRGKKKRDFNEKCVATNPIDRCWRCRADWQENRKLLATCGKGFGRTTTGGVDGEFYVVTDASDDDLVNPRPGTLRWGAIRSRPLWIIFERNMIIRLNEELMINSNKTIDGRGFNIRIANGAGLTVQFVHNVIIHNIHVEGIVASSGGMIRDSEEHYGLRTRSDGDGISIFGSTHVWLDHISMSNCMDGLIDVIVASTAVTISNSHFTEHNDVMLFSANDLHLDDKVMQVTVAFNHFGRGLVQRMPRCRHGFFHVVNNDYTHWLMYAVGGSANATILSQGNRYIAPPGNNANEVTHRIDYATEEEAMGWLWRSQGDLMMNGAFFVEGGNWDKKILRQFDNQDIIKVKPATYVDRLTRYAGCIDCLPGKPC